MANSFQNWWNNLKSWFSGNQTASERANQTSLADLVFNKGGNSIVNSISGYGKRILDPTGFSADFNSAEALKNREFNAAEAEKMRAFNSAEALKNREFQERMSNTAYQRARDDMLKAGLNPYLMYGSGGASSPSGSVASGGSASGSSASVGNGQNLLLPLIHSAVDLGYMSKLF